MTRRGVLAFVLVCALLGAFFYGLLEPHSETVQTVPSGEAALNPYLAFARLLEGMGVPVTTREHLGQVRPLPPTGATLILLGRREYLTQERAAELRDWVERGGHLMLQAWGSEDDRLLHPLGVRIRELDDEESETVAPDAAQPAEGEAAEPAIAPADPEPVLTHWSPERGVDLRIEFDQEYFLTVDAASKPAEVWSDSKGDHGYSFPVGAGHITVWSDDLFMQNGWIGLWDHAELCYRLVRMFGHDGATWIVARDDDLRSLLARILEGAWSLCIALGLWVVFYLWSRAPRFGPIEPDPPAERRELIEHVRASGNFLLRNQRFDTLVNAARSALLRRVQQRHPHWLRLAARARAERIAEHTGMATDEIEAALDTARRTEPGELMNRIATLEASRKRL